MKKSTQKRPALTARQQEIFGIIRRYVYRQGYGPSMRELSEATGIRSPNGIMLHLIALGKKGYIYRNRDKSQLLQIVRPQRKKTAVYCLRKGCLDPNFPEDVLDRLNVLGLRSRTYPLLYIADESFPPFHTGDILFVKIYRRRPKQMPFFHWLEPTNESHAAPPPVQFIKDETVRKFPTGTTYAAYIMKMRLTKTAEEMV